MRRAVDTNVLIYGHMPSMRQHAVVRAFLHDLLRDPETTLVITPAVLHEFIHVVTDPRRFDPPVSMPEAVATARLYVGRSNIEILGTDEASLACALGLLEQHRLGRLRVADTIFAAMLISNDVSEIVTCNPDDFRVFERLKIVNPLSE